MFESMKNTEKNKEKYAKSAYVMLQLKARD